MDAPIDSATAWTTVILTVAPDDAELAADRLFAAGAAAIEEQADGDRTVLLAGFAEPAAAVAAGADAEARGHGPATLRPVTDDGLDAWRPHARVERAGPWWLVPAWLDVPASADPDHVVRLDPGRSFGSGSHATTRLVVAALGDLVPMGARVLDVGCGSGVLSIVAARLGAASVVAIDIDPAAPPATQANAAANGVADRVHASGAALADVVAGGATFDVVVANLLAPVVVALAEDLVASVAPGGRLVVSGLLADRWAEATDRLAPLSVEAIVEADGWAAVTLVRAG